LRQRLRNIFAEGERQRVGRSIVDYAHRDHCGRDIYLKRTGLIGPRELAEGIANFAVANRKAIVAILSAPLACTGVPLKLMTHAFPSPVGLVTLNVTGVRVPPVPTCDRLTMVESSVTFWL